MTKSRLKCGKCGWLRQGWCRNPKSPDVDKYVGKEGFACQHFDDGKGAKGSR